MEVIWSTVIGTVRFFTASNIVSENTLLSLPPASEIGILDILQSLRDCSLIPKKNKKKSYLVTSKRVNVQLIDMVDLKIRKQVEQINEMIKCVNSNC
jgi:hypothetical protein